MIKKIFSKLFKTEKNSSIPSQTVSSSKNIKESKQKEIVEFRKSVNQRLKGVLNDKDKHSSHRSPQEGEQPKYAQTVVKNRQESASDESPHGERERRDRKNRNFRRRGKGGQRQDGNFQNRNQEQFPRSRDKGIQSPTRSPIPEPSPIPEESREPRVPTPTAEYSVFNSEKKFSAMDLSSELSDVLTANNFIHPSKAQEQAIPIALNKKNIICSSETGSGKTLAFVIPILEKFMRKEIDQACILTPTREIAIQIEAVMKPLSDALGISSGLAIGGMDMLLQKKILRDYPQVIIATPGRLVDVSSQGLVWLNYCSVVVLDEVDRMLDMGFEKEISALFELFPPEGQILMFTATMNKELERLSKNYIKDYELLTIGEAMKTKASIEHLFISLPSSERYQTLKSLLSRKKRAKVLVFFNSIDETIRVFQQLKRDHLPQLNCLHSRKSQNERNSVMTGFRSDKINHLLTTDVLARGIDIPNIDIVINYELPRDSEDYIHRIGRTGRADFAGKALSFVNKKDEIKLKKIKKLIKSEQGFNFIGLDELKNF